MEHENMRFSSPSWVYKIHIRLTVCRECGLKVCECGPFIPKTQDWLHNWKDPAQKMWAPCQIWSVSRWWQESIKQVQGPSEHRGLWDWLGSMPMKLTLPQSEGHTYQCTSPFNNSWDHVCAKEKNSFLSWLKRSLRKIMNYRGLEFFLKSFPSWKQWCFDPWEPILARQKSKFFVKLIASYTAAAAAKSLQSCPTLCNPIDQSPPGSAMSGILQARTREWVAISFSNAWKWKVEVNLLSRVRLFATPWTAAYQLLHPWNFPGKSTGVGCHCILWASYTNEVQIRSVFEACVNGVIPKSVFWFW